MADLLSREGISEQWKTRESVINNWKQKKNNNEQSKTGREKSKRAA